MIGTLEPAPTTAQELPLSAPSAVVPPRRLLLLMQTFGLSIGDVARAANGSISKTQIHRIINGKSPSPSERAAVACGVLACLRSRCDSAFLFGE